MRTADLIRLSLQNLWRRKLRTLLTVLGVLIGTASIISMVSIGIGQQQAFLAMVAGSNELTTITVTTLQGFDPYLIQQSNQAADAGQLTDESVGQISRIPHVTLVSPVLSLPVLAFQGKYQGNLMLKGLTSAALHDLNVRFAKGGFDVATDAIGYVVGPNVRHSFYDPQAMSKMSMYDTYAPPEVDLVDEPFFLVYDVENFHAAEPGTAKAKKYVRQASGAMMPAQSWNAFTDGMLAELDALKAELTRVFRGRAWPGQPRTRSGRALSDIVYAELYVRTDDMQNTKLVMEQISALGFRPQSNLEWIEQSEAQARQQQMVLGGIGAISLIVAAIGIANTMMMSIYERTREIGVFKVLGCKLAAIRNLFLLEAACIGGLGGLAGCGLAYLVSSVINGYSRSGAAAMASGGLPLSVIPPWLTAAALLFASVIGMLSGLMPALRAMRLSPLEALRTN